MLSGYKGLGIPFCSKIYLIRCMRFVDGKNRTGLHIGKETLNHHDEGANNDHEKGLSKKKKRLRQHVNPLKSYFQQDIDPQTIVPSIWKNQIFKNPELPLHLDLGCGEFLHIEIIENTASI